MSFSDPQKNIQQFELDPGMTVVDLGSGSGFYAIHAGQEVGLSGRVIAVDIQKDLLERIKSTAREYELSNIEVLLVDLEGEQGLKLKAGSVDAVIASNLFFQIENKEYVVKDIHRILKVRGKVLVIDWSDSFGGLGPSANNIVPEHVLRGLFEKNGFVTERQIMAGAHHYGFIVRKT